MGLEKFFDRVNHDHPDVSGSQANQRQGIAVVDSVLSTSGNPWTGITASREGNKYTTLV